MTNRIRVAVVFGGRSNEHAVSCVSAGAVLRNLDPERYEAVPIGITPQGTWMLGGADVAALGFGEHSLPAVDDTGTELLLATDPSRSGDLIPVGDPTAALGSVDVVFPVLHGPFGEDGTVQGMLELAGLPYVGPGVLASAAGMDKEFTKKLLAAEGLPIGVQVVLRARDVTVSEADRQRLGLPVFVKPARGGSSIGITKVTDWAELDAAIAGARAHDPKVIVEAGIVGREVECGVLEFPDGRIEASVIAEIRMPEVDAAAPQFYDFETKYLDDVCEFDVPAKLDDAVGDEIRALAVRAFRALDCQGLARVDFFVTADGPVINEINTMPGFTAISMYPRMWEATGIDYRTLVSTLIETALARGTGLR
ncbi:D-alanine--D-alanine ligase [Nocardia cyriacigeorgica]|uniref:D-alanine--D-alanine ligase family protein n=1 Tax=Nocardia cyriacigeorgica TaxID=135487 RepID=UPI001893F0B6|nr:D-alanine--D-alanine ligase family protein [Nocardia cyriacigeorgica]MBF6158752.1 D-alanine--D-alanine ligase [Nocardia cyriacigeorgica]MBF6197562.1 D-alanine--D-alanine ligase [Nocardia cyriacigeorgica]MBF6316428.1 D-alanine--D-alanine ligase [Nocardia cyriacigeorgica]MBF6517381.1 D-alanine--D-alanine ligase [Nocardia cyriacigeorgica]MBF6534745.1 D-alanine--D-alanine ligase [Nocardia cyriacigeorgica]